MVSPAVFIPVAEKCGLIYPIGLWVLRTACREALDWDGIKLSINVSPAQTLTIAGTGAIIGPSGYNKGGAGTMVVNAATSYSGATIVSAGTACLSRIRARGRRRRVARIGYSDPHRRTRVAADPRRRAVGAHRQRLGIQQCERRLGIPALSDRH